jgi:hypothetical protein
MSESPTPSLVDLSTRLTRLERSNRRHRVVALVASLACLGWTACALGPEKQSVKAERFVLLGPDGSEQATLEVDPKGHPYLLMKSGEASAFLTTRGPSLLLRGQDGKTGAFLGVDSKDISRLELCSQRLLDGVRLTAHPDGSAGVYVLDPTGRERGSLECSAGGGTGVNFRDEHGRMLSHLGLDASQQPNVILMSPSGARRMGMVVDGEGTPALEMADGKGRLRARMTTRFDGSPALEFFREDGSASFSAP